MHVVAMIRREEDAFGVSFPDFPGCTTIAKDLDVVVAKAAEVLAVHAEAMAENGRLPQPRTLSQLQTDPDFINESRNAMLVLVPYEPPARAVRINMTVEETLLARIDRAAEVLGETRSRYLAVAARLRMAKPGDRSVARSSLSRIDCVDEIAPGEPFRTWSGFLKLSLVACPISIFPAFSEGSDSLFRPINRKTGNQLKRHFVDAGTSEPVVREDIVRGYEFERGMYVPMEDEDIERVDIESAHTIDILGFIPRDEIDVCDVQSIYYVAPTDEIGQEAFSVIREAMRGKGVLAISRVFLADRERPIVLEPFGKGLRAMTLRHPHELRSEAEYFKNIRDVRLPKEMVSLAEHIVESKAMHFDASLFEDEHRSALQEMVKRKQHGKPPRKPLGQLKSQGNVINLMDALKRSIKGEKRKQSAVLQAPRRAGGS
jgi:DNA end-binding protein Ku